LPTAPCSTLPSPLPRPLEALLHRHPALLLPPPLACLLQGVSSRFGAFLDPVADKLMVATAMVLLSTQPLPAGLLAGNAWLVPLLTCGGCRMGLLQCVRRLGGRDRPRSQPALRLPWVVAPWPIPCAHA
jgi:hypothetical protein